MIKLYYMCVYHSGTLVSTMPENKPGGAGHLRPQEQAHSIK
jgi:hypothetical protein